MLALLFLGAAIISEVIGAIATRFSEGFTRLIPTALTVTGVIGAYYLLSLALVHGMTVGVAYAIWAGIGVSAVALIGGLFLGDRLTWTQVGGLALVIGGVTALQLG